MEGIIRVREAMDKGECKLILDTPYHHIETDTYLAFTKCKGHKNIEINNMTLDDIKDFQSKLFQIILENEEAFMEED